MTRQHRQQSRGKSEEVRPTTSRVLSALFSMFGPEGVQGLAVLDLYAGAGGFGLTALRRGAARLVMVEKNYRRCEDLKAAAAAISGRGAEFSVKVVRGDVLRVLPNLARSEEPFDVVFADPPYADNPFAALAERLESGGLLSAGGTVMLEHFHKTEVPDELPGLTLVTRRQYGDSAISVYRSNRPNRSAGEGA